MIDNKENNKQCAIQDVSGFLPNDEELAEAIDTAIYRADSSINPWLVEFKEQLKLSGYTIVETNDR